MRKLTTGFSRLVEDTTLRQLQLQLPRVTPVNVCRLIYAWNRKRMTIHSKITLHCISMSAACLCGSLWHTLPNHGSSKQLCLHGYTVR